MSSKQVANAALRMAITASRTEESSVKRSLGENGIKAVAVDFGGEFVSSVSKIVERAVVAAKREGVIKDTHPDEGAVAGAARKLYLRLCLKLLA